MSVYEVGQKIKNAFGLIESYDMTLEATVTKLMWILGQTKEPEQVKEEAFTQIQVTDRGLSFTMPACSVMMIRVK